MADLDELLGYLGGWAARTYRKATGQSTIADSLTDEERRSLEVNRSISGNPHFLPGQKYRKFYTSEGEDPGSERERIKQRTDQPLTRIRSINPLESRVSPSGNVRIIDGQKVRAKDPIKVESDNKRARFYSRRWGVEV